MDNNFNPQNNEDDASLQQQLSSVDLKTLVLVSVNLAGFEVKMNVGNVMGNVQ